MPPLPLLVAVTGVCALAPALGMVAILTRARKPWVLYWVATATYYILFATSFVTSDFDAGPGTTGYAAAGGFLVLLPVGLLLCGVFLVSAFRPS